MADRVSDIFALPRDQFDGLLNELESAGRDTSDLRRQYRRENSIFSGLYDWADSTQEDLASEGRRGVGGGLLSKDIGSTGGDALSSMRLEPGAFVSGLLGGAGQALDAPAAAARGDMLPQDMIGEALGTAGVAQLGGAAMTAPSGALRSGLARDAATPAETVSRMLADGRAADVTDDMMAAVDPQEMFRLYESGATGVDMPMDAASRAARAEGMGFDTGTDLYHGTRFAGDIQSFEPSSRTGYLGTYFAKDPSMSNDFTLNGMTGAPIEGSKSFPSLAVSGNRADITDRGAWADGLDQSLADDLGLSQMDFINSGFRGDEPFFEILESADISGNLAQKWGSLDFMDMHDGGEMWNRVITDPTNIRSRFARFDPRLGHLSNLNAANASPMTGLLAAPVAQETQELPFQKFLRGLFQ